MADDNFRSNSGRNSWARGEGARDGAHDPLAELARLIGQGDPYAAERSARRSADAAAPEFDWAANEDYADEGGHAEEHYAPPPLPPASYPAYARDEQDYADEPSAGARYFSGSAGKFNGFGADPGAYASDDQAPGSSRRQLPAFMSAAPVGPYEAEELERAQEAGEDYGDYAEQYYDELPPRRRGGLVVMMAVLGLVIVGTAGAFAYRNMFGSAVFAGLPPIIKAGIAPNKILPNNGDAQADNSAQSGTSAQANSDKLVSREEQPVNMEPPKIGSRVVATIPIGAGQMPPPVVAAAPAPAAPDASAPSYSTASASTASVPQPDGSQPAPPPMPTTAAALPAAPASAAAPSEPKKVRTVLIRADQSGATAALPAAAVPAPAPRSARSAAAKTSASPAAAPVGANAPLSIVPGADGEVAPPAAVAPAPVAAAPSRSRAAAAAPAPVALASADPGAAAAPASASGGGYAVQVTSQHSEADAKASFKELRAKFPNQLSGREPMIRRADLGAKGVYYRALVGPFASMEEAAGVCSSLKAAGGNCLVQRN